VKAWRLLSVAALASGLLPLTGCATVTRGTHAPFKIVSVPAGAHVQLSSGESCLTPCTLELPRGNGFQARLSLSGYVTQTLPVTSRGSGGGVIGFLANGAVGGIVGAATDVDSGAMRSLSPNPLVVRLDPIPPAPPKHETQTEAGH
jgi:hypothetical protein